MKGPVAGRASARRWDEEAALTRPQMICGLNTDSKSKGKSGQGEHYHRDHWMRPGRQDERDLRAVWGWKQIAGDGANDPQGDDGVFVSDARAASGSRASLTADWLREMQRYSLSSTPADAGQAG